MAGDRPSAAAPVAARAVVRALGYKLILVSPDSMSIERRRLMLACGAVVELTPRDKGMTGSIARAREPLAAMPGGWMPQQFSAACRHRWQSLLAKPAPRGSECQCAGALLSTALQARQARHTGQSRACTQAACALLNAALLERAGPL